MARFTMFSNSVAKPLVSPAAFLDVITLEHKCREKNITVTLRTGECECTTVSGETEREPVPAEILSSWSDFFTWMLSFINGK